jgi:hypothetical protein
MQVKSDPTTRNDSTALADRPASELGTVIERVLVIGIMDGLSARVGGMGMSRSAQRTRYENSE